jgi:hypothetical protein
VIRVGVDGALLGAQHLLVLAEHAVHRLPQLGGDGLAVQAVVAHERPEVVRGAVGLGGDRVHHVAVDALAAVALGRAGARLRHTDVDADGAGGLEGDDLPAVDLAGEAGELVAHVLQPERRGVDVTHPPGDGDRAALVRHLELGLGQLLLADARGVDELLVGEVHEVVEDELVVAVGVDRLAVACPARVVHLVHVGHGARVGQVGVAGPHPDVPVAFDDRVGRDHRTGVDRLLRGHSGAAAGRVVAQAVVGALQFVAQDPAHRQRRQPVPAGVGEGDGAAVGGAPEGERDAGDGAGKGLLAGDLVVPGGDVPGVAGVVEDLRRCGGRRRGGHGGRGGA